MVRFPEAYKGSQPYIFVSYAHRDAELVLPLIQGLQDRGVRVWYDAGIEVATEWPEYIAEHLAKSACVVTFITQAALESHNCRREIHYAIKLRKDPLVVYLEEVALSFGMDMQIGSLQALYYQRYPTDGDFLDALAGADLLQGCRCHEAEPVREEPAYSEEFLRYKSAAEQGDVGAQLWLGYFFDYGLDDDAEAVKWYALAAQQGNANAQLSLGDCFLNAKGLEADPVQAALWYHRAAEQGSALAQFRLGCLCEAGLGVPQNYIEAARWYALAAAQGNTDAQNRLGICYQYARGVPMNDAEAAKWFTLAAQRRNTDAQYNLGLCHKLGKGLPPDQREAAKWFRTAAMRGHRKAQYQLARCYHNGRGVAKDIREALSWYRKAGAEEQVQLCRELLRRQGGDF